MIDARLVKLASILVHYSLGVQPDDRLRMISWIGAEPLTLAVYREAMRAGALITVQLRWNELIESLLREGSDAQVSYISDLDRLSAEYFDKAVFIGAEQNSKALTTADPRKSALRAAATRPISQRLDEREAAGEYTWCYTAFPTQSSAQDAFLSLEEYEQFYLSACKIHLDDPVAGWREQSVRQQRIADFLMAHDHIRIVAPGTDISYRCGGRKWINADGRVNFPDGEVFSAPIEDSVNGVVTYSFPAIYMGREVEQVRLTFRDGEVVEAEAGRGRDFLDSMLAADDGAKRLGEVAFGTNYDITHFTKNILFDEKIGGTMHMAIGSTYKATGGLNESGVHWDMICDLRQGEVYADGVLCYKDGHFVLP